MQEDPHPGASRRLGQLSDSGIQVCYPAQAQTLNPPFQILLHHCKVWGGERPQLDKMTQNPPPSSPERQISVIKTSFLILEDLQFYFEVGNPRRSKGSCGKGRDYRGFQELKEEILYACVCVGGG